MSTKTDLAALKDLKDHRGWAIVMETIRAEIDATTLQISEDLTLTEGQLRYWQGTLAAAAKFPPVLDKLIAYYEGQVTYEDEQAKTQQATENFNGSA